MNKREAKAHVREHGKIFGRRYDRPYVWISLCIVFEGQPLGRTGVARCSEKDKWNINVGEKIATGRAVAKLADDLVARSPWDGWMRFDLRAGGSEQQDELDARDKRIAELRVKALRLLSALAGCRVGAVGAVEIYEAAKSLRDAMEERKS